LAESGGKQREDFSEKCIPRQGTTIHREPLPKDKEAAILLKAIMEQIGKEGF
jgi:hypothetical protein